MHHARIAFGCLIVLATLAGCGTDGPDTSYVEGVVTLDGEPLSDATVTFSPAEGSQGKPASGKTDANGVYKLTDMRSEVTGTGAMPGRYLVAIKKVSGTEQEDPDAWKNDPNYGKMNYSPRETVTLKSAIPTEYGKPATSGLEATVESGRNENVDFALTSK